MKQDLKHAPYDRLWFNILWSGVRTLLELIEYPIPVVAKEVGTATQGMIKALGGRRFLEKDT